VKHSRIRLRRDAGLLLPQPLAPPRYQDAAVVSRRGGLPPSPSRFTFRPCRSAPGSALRHTPALVSCGYQPKSLRGRRCELLVATIHVSCTCLLPPSRLLRLLTVVSSLFPSHPLSAHRVDSAAGPQSNYGTAAPILTSQHQPHPGTPFREVNSLSRLCTLFRPDFNRATPSRSTVSTVRGCGSCAAKPLLGLHGVLHKNSHRTPSLSSKSLFVQVQPICRQIIALHSIKDSRKI
jgi:hypothetical protein